MSSCTKSIDFFLAFCIGLLGIAVNISLNGWWQPKESSSDTNSIQTKIGWPQNNLSPREPYNNHYGSAILYLLPKKATLFTYERVYFGLTGCTAVWLYKYVLKKFIHPESCPCCCLSLGMYCIVTSQDYSYTEQSGRKEKKLPGEGEKMVRSCVKNWMWNGRKWRNFQDHLWTQKVGLSFAYLRKVLSNQILVLFFQFWMCSLWAWKFRHVCDLFYSNSKKIAKPKAHCIVLRHPALLWFHSWNVCQKKLHGLPLKSPGTRQQPRQFRYIEKENNVHAISKLVQVLDSKAAQLSISESFLPLSRVWA